MHMDRLSGLTAFVRTADLGSFAAAGRVLGLSASAVGKAVSNLERQLGVAVRREFRPLSVFDLPCCYAAIRGLTGRRDPASRQAI